MKFSPLPLAAVLLFASGAVSAAEPAAATLSIKMSGFQSAEGQVLIAV